MTMSEDKQLKQDVLAELAWEPRVAAAHIGVTANAGVITLLGHVESFVEKHAAEAAAARVKGVRAVAEEIEVRLPFDKKRGDEEIAAAAISRLAWDVSVPQDTIKVKVEQGWISLAGQVRWHYQKESAAEAVRGLLGIVGISNQITIKQQVNASNVSDDIMHAVHRSWFFDPQTVTVSADSGKIRLGGTVRSWHDRRVAQETAWAAPGAISVENHIAVV
jgi:osmotically-inducible protein OsmY